MSSANFERRGPRRNPFLLLPSSYHTLLRAYGRQRWWPARTRFEVIVGSILTQNVSWRNAAKAIGSLRRSGLLNPERMSGVSPGRLESLIRSAGFFREKARTLLGFLRFLEARHGGSLSSCLRQPKAALRAQLLALRGIGPETADAIVLYAAGHPSFVVDAYTRRILERHGLLDGSEGYDEVQSLFEAALPGETELFKDYHALLVRAGKEHCHRSAPDCRGCPLKRHLPRRGPVPLFGPAAVRKLRNVDFNPMNWLE
jgi:endonuclease III related protein